ncbi:MAG: hypothetical protein P1V20_03495 [Verrucomicrobiales bacterium]|nr:hypothetical protein [Verrucomicrobiales bacterium]
MKKRITLSTTGSIIHTAKALCVAFESKGFGLTLVNSLKELVPENGSSVARDCQTFAICRPEQVGKGLDPEMKDLITLPYVISLCREDGKTVISATKPPALLSIADSAKQRVAGKQTEEMMITIIEEVFNSMMLEPKSVRHMEESR